MYKYLLFLIIGIILFILLNSKDSFNVGSQFEVELLENPSPLVLTQTLQRILYDVLRDEDLCEQSLDIEGLQCCRAVNERMGGACQMYTIVAFFLIFGITLDATDAAFLNSFGTNLGRANHFHDALRCLMNTTGADDDDVSHVQPFLEGVLQTNGINPQIKQKIQISDFIHGRIYIIDIRLFVPPQYSISRDNTDIGNYTGHIMLLYKTNYPGFKQFVEGLGEELGENEIVPIDQWNELMEVEHSRGYIILEQLNRKLAALDLLYDADPNDPIITHGIVCICIDHYNRFFYALTELDNPVTMPPPPPQARKPTSPMILYEYNKIWGNKLVFGFFSLNAKIIDTDLPHHQALIELVDLPSGYPNMNAGPGLRMIHRLGNTSKTFTDSEFYISYNSSQFSQQSLEYAEDFFDPDVSAEPSIGIGVPNFWGYSFEMSDFSDTFTRNETCYGKVDRKCMSNMECDSGLSCADQPFLIRGEGYPQFVWPGRPDDIDRRGPICVSENAVGVKCDKSDDDIFQCGGPVERQSLFCLDFNVDEQTRSNPGDTNIQSYCARGSTSNCNEFMRPSPLFLGGPPYTYCINSDHVCIQGECVDRTEPTVCAASGGGMVGGTVVPPIVLEYNVHPSAINSLTPPNIDDWCNPNSNVPCGVGTCTGSNQDDELDNEIYYYVCE